MKLARTTVATCLAILLAVTATAQTKGKIRISGKVVNEMGQPVEGAEVRAAKKGEAQPQTPLVAKTNKDGEWSFKDLAAGEWMIEATKEGIGIAEHTATLTDAERNATIPPLTIKPKVDPNAEIQAGHKQAIELAQAGKVAEARKIWEDLVAKYPQVHQFYGMIGTMYAAENNPTKGIEYLNMALEKDPGNTDWLALKGELMMEAGDKAEAEKILLALDVTKVRDPRALMNLAINKINAADKAQAAQAIELLDKMIPQFPDQHMLLYLRARAYIVGEKLAEAKADLEKYVAAAPPTAPQMAEAKKLLEQLTKK